MLVLALLAACGGETSDTGDQAFLTDQGLYELMVDMDPHPPTVGDSTLTVMVHDAATGEPVADATLAVTPWMPEHGHGVSEDPVVSGEGGTFTVTFAYSMPGTWELTFDVDSSLGADSAVLTVDVE